MKSCNMKESVKVLAVVTQLNRGGIESRLMDILRNTDYSKIQIDIFTCNMKPGIYDEEAQKLGSKIYYNPRLHAGNMIKYIHYFENFLLTHKEYKIIHAHQNAWCMVFCKGAFLADVPIRIAHSRTAVSTFSLKNICKNIIKLSTRKYATHYFAVSDKAGIWLFGKRNFLNGNIRIWKNAIDCKQYLYDEITRGEERKKLQISDCQTVVIHVGNFTQSKNHEFLIKVFAELKKRDRNALLVLVGGDFATADRMGQIKSITSEMRIEDSVLFLGIRDDVNRLLQAGDVFVFPSLFEGFPGAVLEAQAAGLPCLISDNITKEVCILETTQQMSLKDPISCWVDKIEELRKTSRENSFEKLQDMGFDIHTLTYELQEFYLKEAEKLSL